MFNTASPSSGELELWFIAFCGFLWYKYSHLGQFQFPSLTSSGKELGKDAPQHTIVQYFHHAHTIDVKNLKSIDNSEVWSNNGEAMSFEDLLALSLI